MVSSGQQQQQRNENGREEHRVVWCFGNGLDSQSIAAVKELFRLVVNHYTIKNL